MNTIVDLKNSCSGLDVEFEIMPVVDMQNIKDDRQRQIIEGTASIDEQLSEVQDKIAKLNEDIDRLTNQADGIDYVTAVVSGIITGIIDATIVGEWNFKEAKGESNKKVNNKVVEYAKKQPGYEEYCKRTNKNPNSIDTAIHFLESKFHLPGDGAYQTGNYGINGRTHRLDDYCHHPTIVGLICCIITQFTGKTHYSNSKGETIKLPVTVNDYGEFEGNSTVTKLFSGVINWFIICAKTKKNWEGHLMSDMATSQGIPGSFLSIIKELASIPCFQNENFLNQLGKAYSNGFGTGKGQVDLGVFNKLFEGAESKLDMRTEKAIKHELKRQAIPVVINEVLVRATYFIRRLISELKEKQDVKKIEWKKVIPFNNRTIVRMMTIATGTFTAIDMADAAIHSAEKSVGVTEFFSNMILRVNFVGVGRFAVAVVSDVGMGVSRSLKRNERIRLQEEQLLLLDAKLYYKQSGMWIAAENTGVALAKVYSEIEKTTQLFIESLNETKHSLNNIGTMVPAIEKKNPDLIDDILDVLDWG